VKIKNTAFWQKTQHFGKIVAFDENHHFRDFCVSMIIYCPYLYFILAFVGIYLKCIFFMLEVYDEYQA